LPRCRARRWWSRRYGWRPEAAAGPLRKLARLLDVADSRANLAYGSLNALLLLDVHLQRALEAWKTRHGTRGRAWLDALGEVEALSGLSTLAHDESRWVFPEEGATANGQGTRTVPLRARAVLRHLLDAGAVGAVTTHDLTLHQAPDLEVRTRAFHFRESVTPGEHGAALSFDYRLRPGLSTTRNAMVLLEAWGWVRFRVRRGSDPGGRRPGTLGSPRRRDQGA